MNILRLSRLVFVALALAAAVPAQAAVAMAALPAANDGKSLKDKDCIDCRAQLYAVGAARIYFRGERRTPTSDPMLAQVSYCSPELGASYFPEEEEHIAAYLNKQYYRFK